MVDLSGQCAFITGASRGIGAAAARKLAADGARVVLAARDLEASSAIAGEIETNGGRALALACDVARFADVQGAVDRAVSEFGEIDIVVNNAGLIDPIARLEESAPDAWNRVVDVNLKGVYHLIRAVLPQMAARRSGTIINISSGAATGALEGWSHYCATKAAVLSLTKCTHKEVGDQGVRVVGLSPGTVATDMQISIRASGVNPVSQLDPSAHIPAEWVADAIAWLTTEAADPFLGGDFSLKTNEGRTLVGLPPVHG